MKFFFSHLRELIPCETPLVIKQEIMLDNGQKKAAPRRSKRPFATIEELSKCLRERKKKVTNH